MGKWYTKHSNGRTLIGALQQDIYTLYVHVHVHVYGRAWYTVHVCRKFESRLRQLIFLRGKKAIFRCNCFALPYLYNGVPRCMYMYIVHILQKIFKFCLHIIIYMYIQSVGIIDTCICGMLFQPLVHLVEVKAHIIGSE